MTVIENRIVFSVNRIVFSVNRIVFTVDRIVFSVNRIVIESVNRIVFSVNRIIFSVNYSSGFLSSVSIGLFSASITVQGSFRISLTFPDFFLTKIWFSRQMNTPYTHPFHLS